MVVVVVMAIVLLAFYEGKVGSLAGAGGGSPSPPPPAKVIVAKAGSLWSLGAGAYEQVGPVSLPSGATSWSTSGGFTATHGITAYILTSHQFAGYTGGTPGSYVWTSGPVDSGSVNASGLAPGTYEFVWDNSNSATSSSAKITTDVVCTPG